MGVLGPFFGVGVIPVILLYHFPTRYPMRESVVRGLNKAFGVFMEARTHHYSFHLLSVRLVLEAAMFAVLHLIQTQDLVYSYIIIYYSPRNSESETDRKSVV